MLHEQTMLAPAPQSYMNPSGVVVCAVSPLEDRSRSTTAAVSLLRQSQKKLAWASGQGSVASMAEENACARRHQQRQGLH